MFEEGDNILHNIKFIVYLPFYSNLLYKLLPQRVETAHFWRRGNQVLRRYNPEISVCHACVCCRRITPLLPVHADSSLNKDAKLFVFADNLLRAGKLINLNTWRSIAGPRWTQTWLSSQCKKNLSSSQKCASGPKLSLTTQTITVNVSAKAENILLDLFGAKQARDKYANDLVSYISTK